MPRPNQTNPQSSNNAEVVERVRLVSSVAATIQTQVIDPEGITQYKLAKRCGMARQVMSEILKGRRLTTTLAMKLDQGTHISAVTWMRLDADDRLDAELLKREAQGEVFDDLRTELSASDEIDQYDEFDESDLEDWVEEE